MKGNNNFFTPDNMMTSDSFLHDDSTFIVMGQSPNIVKLDNTVKDKIQQALISKMINQFQRPTVQQSNNKKVNPFLAETKNNQDLSKFFGPIESKTTLKKKKTLKSPVKGDQIQPQNYKQSGLDEANFDFIDDFSSSDYDSLSESDIPKGESREDY